MSVKLIERFISTGKLLESDRKKLPAGVLCKAKYQICSMGEKNRNNRVYEREVWDKVLADTDIQEKLKNRSLFFHAEHPAVTQSNTEKVAGIVSDINMDEQKVYATMEVLDTPYGRIVDTLLKANCGVGVSTRADGELEECMDESGNKYSRVIPEAYRFVTVDFTADPSSYGSEMPIEVQRGVAGVVKSSLDSESMDRAYATVLLEHMKIDEAKTILESMKIDKHHKDCKCKPTEKHCLNCSHVNEGKPTYDYKCDCGNIVKGTEEESQVCTECDRAMKRIATHKPDDVIKESSGRFQIGDLVWYEGKKWEVADHLKGTYALWSPDKEHKTEHEGWVPEDKLSRTDESLMESDEVAVDEIPDCDFCAQAGKKVPAEYDGRTSLGPWANMCAKHFKQYGMGLGTGKGQKLIKEARGNMKRLKKETIGDYVIELWWRDHAVTYKVYLHKFSNTGRNQIDAYGTDGHDDAVDKFNEFAKRAKDEDYAELQKTRAPRDKKKVGVTEVVKKVGKKWQVQSKKGKNLGTYGTEAEAKKRLGEVEYFKHKANEDMTDAEAIKKLAGSMDQANAMAQNAQGTTRVTEDSKSKMLKLKAEAEKYYSYLKYIPDNEDIYDYIASAIADDSGLSYDQAMEEVEAVLGKLEEAKVTESEEIERYAKNNNLEIVFSEGHRNYDRIFYDSREGKYYDRETDMFLEENELDKFGLGAKGRTGTNVRTKTEEQHGGDTGTDADAGMDEEHPGAYCEKCGKTATEGEYSQGACKCGGDIVAESVIEAYKVVADGYSKVFKTEKEAEEARDELKQIAAPGTIIDIVVVKPKSEAMEAGKATCKACGWKGQNPDSDRCPKCKAKLIDKPKHVDEKDKIETLKLGPQSLKALKVTDVKPSKQEIHSDPEDDPDLKGEHKFDKRKPEIGGYDPDLDEQLRKAPKDLVKVVKAYYKEVTTTAGKGSPKMTKDDAIKHISVVTSRPEDEIRGILKEDVSMIMATEGQIGQYLSDNWGQFLDDQDAVDNLVKTFRISAAKAKEYVETASKGKGRIANTYAIESKLKEVTKNYVKDAIYFGRKISTLKDGISGLAAEKTQNTQALSLKIDENTVLNEKISEIESENKQLTKDIKEKTARFDKEIADLKKIQEKALLKMYRETKIKCMGLRLSEQCLTILESCKTPAEVDTAIRQYQNAFTESALHFSGIKGIEVTETVQVDPKQVEIDTKVEKAMSAWTGKPQTK